jgi:hypothetical protein
MSVQLSIPCPECTTPILLTPQLLLQGIQFSCSKCNAAIGLSNESKHVVQDSLEKFDKIKADAFNGKA